MEEQKGSMSEEEQLLARQHQAMLQLQEDQDLEEKARIQQHLMAEEEARHQQEQMMMQKVKQQQQLLQAEQHQMMVHQQQAIIVQQQEAKMLQQQQMAIRDNQQEIQSQPVATTPSGQAPSQIPHSSSLTMPGPVAPSAIISGPPPRQQSVPPPLMATPILQPPGLAARQQGSAQPPGQNLPTGPVLGPVGGPIPSGPIPTGPLGPPPGRLGGPVPISQPRSLAPQSTTGPPIGQLSSQMGSSHMTHGGQGPPQLGGPQPGNAPAAPRPLLAMEPTTRVPPLMGGPILEGRVSPPPPLMATEIPPPDNDEPKELKLPQALEKVLAFKEVRAQQVGVSLEEVEQVEKGNAYKEPMMAAQDHYIEEFAVSEEEVEKKKQETQKQKKARESKNRKKKEKKKRARARKKEEQEKAKNADIEMITQIPAPEKEEEPDVEIEYIPEHIEIDMRDPVLSQFAKVFDTFKITEPEKEPETQAEAQQKSDTPAKTKEDSDDDDDDEKPDDDDKPKLSKKKLKKMNRLSVAELKQLVKRPDLVEMHDVTAQDPKLLLHLKATRNSVPVPRHWCFKRKYLQGKRGIEKPPFDLPDYIKATGIMEMREALHEKEEQKTMKSKMRERVRPKMGKIDIDYQKLHDAFFKWQIKPKMTIHGDLYYEGKEFETKLKEKKPGNLSDELRTALGMPIGPNAEKFPPPWLIAMQRYGPPPSYPNLKISGLNAPIPEGCAFGYHAGGWGKPPVDQSGKPLYGDVFGTQATDFQTPVQEDDIDKSHWGELESESESESESEEESEEEEETVDKTGLVTPGDAGLVTPSGLTSVPAGMETPDMIELRKKRIEDAMDQGGDTPALYQVLPEKKQSVGGAMMASAHVYDMSAAVGGKKSDKSVESGGVEVALNPEELDLDTAAMQAKYDQTVREQQSQLEKEDLGDMVAEHVAKQKKRKKQQQDTGKQSKKYKEFKF